MDISPSMRLITYFFREYLQREMWMENQALFFKFLEHLFSYQQRIHEQNCKDILRQYFSKRFRHIVKEQKSGEYDIYIGIFGKLGYEDMQKALQEIKEHEKNDQTFQKIILLKNTFFKYLSDDISIEEFHEYYLGNSILSSSVQCDNKANSEQLVYQFYNLIYRLFSLVFDEIKEKRVKDIYTWLRILRDCHFKMLEEENFSFFCSLCQKIAQFEFRIRKELQYFQVDSSK